ncbi:MAG: glutathione S-transferase family protein [Pseudomonadota bacterium]
MLTIHHLRIGRSIFTVWQLEELGIDYDLIEYHRNPETMRAPPELRDIHPLGKSPVIEDDGMILSESGAITAYLLKKYDADGVFGPDKGDAAWAEYTQWLHYPEGSVFSPLLMKLLSMRTGGQPLLDGFADPEVALHFAHISDKLGDNAFILGDRMTGADFGITYMVSMAATLGLLEPYPSLGAYLARNLERPAFQRAKERAVE